MACHVIEPFGQIGSRWAVGCYTPSPLSIELAVRSMLRLLSELFGSLVFMILSSTVSMAPSESMIQKLVGFLLN